MSCVPVEDPGAIMAGRKQNPIDDLSGEDLIRFLIDQATQDFADDPDLVGKDGKPKFTAQDEKLARLPQNDLGNGARLRARCGKDLIFVPEIGWLGWSGKIWSAEDGHDLARKAAHDTARAMRREALALISAGPVEGEDNETFEKRVKGFRRFVKDCGNVSRINAMLEAAAPYVAARIDDLDRPQWVFNAADCALDLLPPSAERFSAAPLTRQAEPADLSPEGRGEENENGGVRRRAHGRKDLVTRAAGARYDPAATCPAFLSFLAGAVPDREIADFLQRFFGYALCGSVREQVVMLFYGQGSNGKSTLMDTITHVMGDYARGVPISSIMGDGKKSAGQASPDLARLRGARYVTTSEPDTGERFSEGTIKMLSGDERMTVRHLNKDYFEFYPQFKVVVSFNNKPNVRGIDEGFWRRIVLVPFDQKFVDPEKLAENPGARVKIKGLGEAMRAEAPGILNWMLDGYRIWREKGLMIPERVRAATDGYRAEANPVAQFAQECVVKKSGARVIATRMFQAYGLWSKENALDAVTQNLFGRRMADMGYVKIKSAGFSQYEHVDLTDDVRRKLDGWDA